MENVHLIRENIEALKALDKQFSVFGSSDHQYKWNAPLTHVQIQVFEHENAIKLTEEHKLILTQLGNGGPGPGYGLASLSAKHILPPYPGTDYLLRNWQGTDPMDIEMVDLDELSGYISLFGYGAGMETNMVINGDEQGTLIFHDCDEHFRKLEHGSILKLYEGWLNHELETMTRINELIHTLPLQEVIDSEWELENYNIKSNILSLIDASPIQGGHSGGEIQLHLEKEFTKWKANR